VCAPLDRRPCAAHDERMATTLAVVIAAASTTLAVLRMAG
jgi:hypothetical protein